MPYQILIKPISRWIGTENKSPGKSQFRKTYSDTLKILNYELVKLSVVSSSVQLEMFIRQEQLFLNGTQLRANAKPYKPGVILSFSVITRRLRDKSTNTIKNETKTLSYPCDAYNDWQDNLRAIALSLVKLRDVARYGVFKHEDMVSRLALPSADGKISDRDAALSFISKWSGMAVEQLTVQTAIKSAFRETAIKLHPDQNDGRTPAEFYELEKIREILGLK